MTRLAIFASGSGSNAENIYQHFVTGSIAEVALIITNNSKAGVIERAERLNIPVLVFSNENGLNTDWIIEKLKEYKIDFIILAGFLLLVPASIINLFPDRIINIHPALLPRFGGKGFYGSHVHQKVIESGSPYSGITIHHVNSAFDDGDIIFQAACHVDRKDTAASLAEKIHALEYKYFPVVIEKLIVKTFL